MALSVMATFEKLKEEKPKLDDQTLAILTVAEIIQDSLWQGKLNEVAEHFAGLLNNRD